MSFDSFLTLTVNGFAGHFDALDWVMIAISQAGLPALVLAVVPFWWVGPERVWQRHVAVSAAFSFLGGLAINQFILLFVQRPRPYVAGVTHLFIGPSADPSFPSDHATAAFAIAATYLLKKRYGLGSAFAAAAVMIAFSRVYVGTHYVSDVVGGMFTGFVAAWLVTMFYRFGERLDRQLTSIL